MDDNSQFVKELKINLSLDLKLRNDLINFNIGVNTKEFKNKISYALDPDYNKKILYLKKLYFGNESDYASSKEVVTFIQSFLN